MSKLSEESILNNLLNMLTIPSISTRSTMLGLRAQSIACAASSHSGCWRSGLIKTRSVATATAKSPRRRQNLIGRYGPSCQIIHHYSTDSASLDSSPTSSPPPPSTSLTWNDYLALRRSRRNYNLVASVATCAGSTASGVLLVNNYFELIGTYITLDPFFIIIIGTVASAGIGWLSGPILGNFVFRMFHRRVTGEMAEVKTTPLMPFQAFYSRD